MKKNQLVLLSFLTLVALACNTSSKTEETAMQAVQDSLVAENDTNKVNQIMNEFIIYPGIKEPKIIGIGKEEIIKFFETRNEIFSLPNTEPYNKINYQNVKVITLGELLKFCEGDIKGHVLFSFKLVNNVIDYEIFGTTDAVSEASIQTDIPSLAVIIPNTNDEYFKMGLNFRVNKFRGFLNFNSKTRYVSFSKINTKTYLEDLKKTHSDIDDETKLYLHYGFSGTNGDSHHGILVTNMENLQTRYSNLQDSNITQFAFGNKNGTCCPPQY
jgi:hypothetical protein